MGNSVVLPFSRRPGRTGCGTVSRLLEVLLVTATLLMWGTIQAAENGSGIIIYTTLDNGRDETAIAVPFIKAEQFALVTNVTTADGKSFRVTNNMFKEIVRPPDLSRLTVVDEAGLQSFKAKAQSLRALQKRFPRAAGALEGTAGEMERLIQVIEGGNVLFEGRVVPRADYDRQVAATRGKAIDITLNGRAYTGAKLSSVGDGKASITHTGGVASIQISQLTDKEIELLNQTSNSLRISKGNPPPLASTTTTREMPMQNAPPSLGEPPRIPPSESPQTANSPAQSSERTERVRRLGKEEMEELTRSALEQIALRIFEEREEMQLVASGKGLSVDARSIEEIYEFNTQGLLRMEDYEKTMLAADYAADNFGITLTGKAALEAARIEWAESTTNEGREAAREKMRQAVQNEAGVDLMALATNMSKADLRAGLGADTVIARYEALALSERSRMISSFKPVCQAANVDLSHADAIHFIFITLNFKTRLDLYKALEAGDDIESILLGCLPAYHRVKAGFVAASLVQVGSRSMMNIESLVGSRRDLMNISSYESPLRLALETR